jgi:hypothetical protein
LRITKIEDNLDGGNQASKFAGKPTFEPIPNNDNVEQIRARNAEAAKNKRQAKKRKAESPQTKATAVKQKRSTWSPKVSEAMRAEIEKLDVKWGETQHHT